MQRMNHPEGKRLLARVRGGDYAHPGEEEAISLLWEKLPKNRGQECLDAGCGRGGTAAVVQAVSWGWVTGVDIDEKSVLEAGQKHPAIEFVAADIGQVGSLFPGRFDVIYAFNAFYAFPDQAGALRSLREASKTDGRLAIFDYVDRGRFRKGEFYQITETKLWQPMQMETMPGMLEAAGWRLTEVRDIDEDYRRWYANLVERFASQQEELRAEFSAELIDYATAYYEAMFRAVDRGELGGAIVYASAA